MRTILVADDQVSLRQLVMMTLEADDYRILEAADGDMAWTVIQQERPDLVLLDMMMPGRNGLDVIRLVRGEPALAEVKLVMLSAQSGADEIAQALAAGADHYLTKPFSPRALMDLVEGMLL